MKKWIIILLLFTAIIFGQTKNLTSIKYVEHTGFSVDPSKNTEIKIFVEITHTPTTDENWQIKIENTNNDYQSRWNNNYTNWVDVRTPISQGNNIYLIDSIIVNNVSSPITLSTNTTDTTEPFLDELGIDCRETTWINDDCDEYKLKVIVDKPFPLTLLNDNQQNELAARYMPVLRMDDGSDTTSIGPEYFIPKEVNIMLDHSEIWNNEFNNELVIAGASKESIARYCNRNNYLKFFIDDGGNTTDEYQNAIKNWYLVNENSFNTQLYVSFFQNNNDEIAITYYFYYLYNRNVGLATSDNHLGEWEGMTIVFNKINEEFIPSVTSVSNHKASFCGRRRNWDRVEKIGDHPVVYVANGGHASFLHPGRSDNEIGSPVDYHNGNGIWVTPQNVSNNDIDTYCSTYKYSQPSTIKKYGDLISSKQVEILPRVDTIDLNNLNNYWHLFSGYWGQTWGFIKADAYSPRGPLFVGSSHDGKDTDGSKWFDPITWTNQQANDMMIYYIAPKSGLSPLEVSFEAANLDWYYWNFGDGSDINHDQNTTHTYTSPNQYTIAVGGLDYFYDGILEMYDRDYYERLPNYITVTNPPLTMNSYLDQTSYPVSSTAVLTVELTDPDGNPVSGAYVEMTIDGNTTPLTAITPSGTYQCSFTTPASSGTYPTEVFAGRTGFEDTTDNLDLICTSSTTPDIVVNPGSLDFGEVYAGYYSEEKYFNIIASNLTGNLTVTPPTGYEISSSSGQNFTTSSLTLVPSGGYMNARVYVRIMPMDYITYSGDITCSSSGATTQYVSVTCTGKKLLYPPENLVATVENENDVDLKWGAHGDLHYDNGVNSNCWGFYTDNGESYATWDLAIRYTPSQLTAYDGLYLTSLDIYLGESESNYSVKVWQGVDATTLLVDQSISNITEYEWKHVELNTPVLIDASQELWFGYSAYVPNIDFNIYPEDTHYFAGSDCGPGSQGYGDLWRNTVNDYWITMGEYGEYYNVNWNIQGYVSTTTKNSIAKPLLVDKSIINKNSSNNKSSAKSRHKVVPMAKKSKNSPKLALQGYKIYRDGNPISTINNASQNYYYDYNLANGDYTYTVTALYDEGESRHSKPDSVTIVSSPPNITVNSPNGSETWNTGTTYSITWTDNIVENIKIELYNGTSLEKLITSSTSSDGSYSWTPPNTLTGGSNYKIKITSTNNSSINDYSDSPFTIPEPPNITVSVPNGGESWQMGSDQSITWTDNIGDNVVIELYKGTSMVNQISSSTASDGNYSWTIPETLTAGTDYKVKITSIADTGLYDYSDSNFTIPEIPDITVTAPNGGESWQMGSTQSITWTDNISENVKIELYKNTTMVNQISSSTASDGSYSWSIPTSITAGSDYKIKITGTTDTELDDYSNADFSITEIPVITVTSPNGGENWSMGSTQSITWSDNISENVKIELYKGVSVVNIISETTSSDGSYSWTVPETLSAGTDYKIKITSTADAGLTDYSDTNFTVSDTRFITVTSPNGGETWKAGTSHNITWNDNISDNIKIELYKNNSYYSVIDGDELSDGSYSWSIPYGHEIGTDFKVKITSLVKADSKTIVDAKEIVSDYSNSPFSIQPYFNQVVLLSPSDNDKITDLSPDFDWEDVNGATAYDIIVDNNSDFSTPEISETITESAYQSSFNLTYDTYYWKVRPKDTIYTGNYSSVGSFTIGNPPIPPKLSSPTNDDHFADLTPEFDWSDVAAANGYKIIVDDNSDFSSPIIDSTTTVSEFTPVEDMALGSHYWKVYAVNEFGTGPATATWSFNLGETPVSPKLYTPADYEYTTNLRPDFDWSDVADATGYRLIVDNNVDFTSPEIDTSVSLSNYTPLTDLALDDYSWKVSASNEYGEGDYSSSFSLIVEEPLQNITNISINIPNNLLEITWDTVDRATHYKVYSSNDPYGEFYYTTYVETNSYQVPVSEAKLFYYIIASSEPVPVTKQKSHQLNNNPKNR